MSCVEDCISISTTFLKNQGLFKGSKDHFLKSISWSWQSGNRSSIGFNIIHLEDDLKRMDLSYMVDDDIPVKYSVMLVGIESNLGIGVRWYFICPKTYQRCMKLIKPYYSDYFYHRTAFSILYKQQQRSNSGFFGFIGRIFDLEEKIEVLENELNQKYRKTHYRGKRTPLAKRIAKLENEHPYY